MKEETIGNDVYLYLKTKIEIRPKTKRGEQRNKAKKNKRGEKEGDKLAL